MHAANANAQLDGPHIEWPSRPLEKPRRWRFSLLSRSLACGDAAAHRARRATPAAAKSPPSQGDAAKMTGGLRRTFKRAALLRWPSRLLASGHLRSASGHRDFFSGLLERAVWTQLLTQSRDRPPSVPRPGPPSGSRRDGWLAAEKPSALGLQQPARRVRGEHQQFGDPVIGGQCSGQASASSSASTQPCGRARSRTFGTWSPPPCSA